MISPTRRNLAVTIPTASNGLSAAVNLEDESPLGVLIDPAGWTTAALTFQGSVDGVNFYNLYSDGGTETTVASANVVASRMLVFSSALSDQFRGLRYVKIRSGTSATAVTQASARTLTLLLRQNT